MSPPLGEPVTTLDSPQLLIDLDVVDANLQRMFSAFARSPVTIRVHFKSLKCPSGKIPTAPGDR
jgi:D-serine deaminase-like pyridoxal phosphate-dependent protein